MAISSSAKSILTNRLGGPKMPRGSGRRKPMSGRRKPKKPSGRRK